jgi:hypothetical protein
MQVIIQFIGLSLRPQSFSYLKKVFNCDANVNNSVTEPVRIAATANQAPALDRSICGSNDSGSATGAKKHGETYSVQCTGIISNPEVTSSFQLTIVKKISIHLHSC